MTDEDWRAAWVAALDDLEESLGQAQRLVAAPEDSPDAPDAGASLVWTPPRLPGVLPAELVGRAQSLLARQQEAIVAATSASANLRQQLALIDRLEARPAATTPRSVYLDVSA